MFKLGLDYDLYVSLTGVVLEVERQRDIGANILCAKLKCARRGLFHINILLNLLCVYIVTLRA